ncbi:MAG: class I SAM-dependent methyltransferase [Agriterribacter sp.]
MRKVDKYLLKLLGKKYIPIIWLRSYIKKRFFTKRIKTVSAISVADRKYDTLLIGNLQMFIEALSPKKGLPPFFEGCNYGGGDLEIYDFVIKKFLPARIIEIGSGGSTQFAYYKANNASITAIDPEPRTILPQHDIKFIMSKCEEVPLELFEELTKGDILFIDSSHYKEEAEYHVKHILPVLKSGVIIHHHDIYYPYDVNPQWGEQKVVLDFYFANADKYEIFCPTAFAYYYNNWFFRTKLNLSKRLPHDAIPSSFWVVKK